MVTRIWKIYGAEGHRQRETFNDSERYETADAVVVVFNADITQQHEFSIVMITAATSDDCYQELIGQITDGVFENSVVGRTEEVILEYVE